MAAVVVMVMGVPGVMVLAQEGAGFGSVTGGVVAGVAGLAAGVAQVAVPSAFTAMPDMIFVTGWFRAQRIRVSCMSGVSLCR